MGPRVWRGEMPLSNGDDQVGTRRPAARGSASDEQRDHGYRYFFFPEEDGIRDPLVTGVQTCALPICEPVMPTRTAFPVSAGSSCTSRCAACWRSEERRVGKECRSRGPPYH